MNKQLVAIIVVLVVALGGAGAWFLLKDDSSSSDTQQVDSVSTEKTQTDTANTEAADSSTETQLAQYTVDGVALHATKDDCWTIISGKVYDITEYVPRHPGGDEILMACGTDGTSLFTERKTEDGKEIGSGSPHSSTASSQLARYLLGDLTEATSESTSDPAASAAQ